ncbi:MAG: 3-deoxy-8-phosphooctulonate synthase [Planctomycetes bacterium]|nr:3-deoxy-8-phosphooctulonate synthase [Planctomycetota bacterium]
MTHTCTLGTVTIGKGTLALIAGPCMAESLDLCLRVAETMNGLCHSLGVGYVFKASYDKANRSASGAYRGPGLAKGLKWLAQVRKTIGCPVLSDVHEVNQCAEAGEVLDGLQIPAFLCRQTDLIVEAAKTGKCVNIKKGQFMAPWDMCNAIEKVHAAGNDNALVTERGTFFGYNRLVSDLRAIVQMQAFAPVCFDATHSVQEPGGLGTASGGRREYAETLALAAMATGADALFIETHPEPDAARSDAASQIALSDMGGVVRRCLAVFELVQGFCRPGENRQ